MTEPAESAATRAAQGRATEAGTPEAAALVAQAREAGATETPDDAAAEAVAAAMGLGADAQRIADLRRDYRLASLDESSAHADPLVQFRRWFDEALAAQLHEVNAMTLATVGVDGRAAARIVLLKGVDAGGFVFYTNYTSRKGRELAANPHVALVLHWAALERQVRIEGSAQPVTAAESDAYFASRPLASRIGAWASPQSEPIESRAVLEALETQARERFGEHPPRPPHWGGYRVQPDMIEFWQGRTSRLHDRLCYRRAEDAADGGWRFERLAP